MAKHRGPKEGSIYQRRDGRWCAQISCALGKRKYVYGPTYEDVHRKLVELKAAMHAGLGVPESTHTLGSYLDAWLAHVENNLKPRTLESYRYVVTLHVKPTLGRVRLTELTPGHVQALVAERLKQGLSPRTARYIVTVLSVALNHAVKLGLVARNVCQAVKRPRVPHRLPEYLTPDEARALLEAVQGRRYEALIALAVYLGLREAELAGLKWSDVDLENATLSVARSLQRVRGLGLVEADVKTARSCRLLPLPRPVVEALKRERRHAAEARLLAGRDWKPSPYVFTSSIGTPLDGRRIHRIFTRALERAGLRHVRFHDLRHTAATLLLLNGVNPRVVMELLGHSQISLTMNTYSHVLPTLTREATEKMAKILQI